MAVQEDYLPTSKLVMTLVLGTLGTILAVFTGQFLYYWVQDMEDHRKIEMSSPTDLLELRRQQLGQLHEYRVTDKAQQRISIPLDEAKALVRKELAGAR